MARERTLQRGSIEASARAANADERVSRLAARESFMVSRMCNCWMRVTNNCNIVGERLRLDTSVSQSHLHPFTRPHHYPSCPAKDPKTKDPPPTKRPRGAAGDQQEASTGSLISGGGGILERLKIHLRRWTTARRGSAAQRQVITKKVIQASSHPS